MKLKEKWAEEWWLKNYTLEDQQYAWLAGFEFAKAELSKATLNDMENHYQKTIQQLGEDAYEEEDPKKITNPKARRPMRRKK